MCMFMIFTYFVWCLIFLFIGQEKGQRERERDIQRMAVCNRTEKLKENMNMNFSPQINIFLSPNRYNYWTMMCSRMWNRAEVNADGRLCINKKTSERL